MTECMLRGMWLGTQLRAWVVIFSIGLVACGTLKEGLEDTKRTSSSLKSELGLDAQVGFRTMNGHDDGERSSSATPPIGDGCYGEGADYRCREPKLSHEGRRVDVVF